VKTLLRWPVVLLALAGVALAVMRPNVLGSFGSGSEPARPHKPPALQTGYHTRHVISFESTWTLPSTPVQIIYWRGNIPTVVTQTDLERGLKGAAKGKPHWYIEFTYDPGVPYAMQVNQADGHAVSYRLQDGHRPPAGGRGVPVRRRNCTLLGQPGLIERPF
jgi:hypothetical protein